MILSIVLAVVTLTYIFFPMSLKARCLVAFLVVVLFDFLFWPSTRDSYLLEKHGGHTTGVVVAKDCDVTNNQWIAYRFVVASKVYEGRRGIGGGRIACEGLAIGSQTFVTYLEADPSVNRPEREVVSNWFLGLLISIGLFVVLVWMNGEQTEFRRKKLQTKHPA